jgi:hypothetical protein
LNTTEKIKIIKKIGKDFANELDFYNYKKTEAKFRKIDKEQKLNEFPPLCLKHAPKNYLNIAHEYLNYDGSKINNYLCNKCYPRND